MATATLDTHKPAENAAEPKGNVREAKRLRTRQAILDAAILLFAQRGFDGTGMSAITDICGVPIPLIVYHFKSKDLLWQQAVTEVYTRIERHIDGYTEQIAVATGADYYRIWSRAMITALAAHPEYMRILFQEGTQKSERLKWMVDTHQHHITSHQIEVIKRAQAEKLLPQVDVEHLKFIISGAFCLPLVLAPEYELITGKDALSDAFIERHIELCLKLLLPTAFDGN